MRGKALTFQISEITRQKTTLCPFSFQCLGEKGSVCQVSVFIERDGLLLKKAKHVQCPYKQSRTLYSHSRCSCPTRIELYKQYRI